MLAAIHVALCLWFHYDRAWQGDEWGSRVGMEESYTYLLTHFSAWMSMIFYLSVLKVIRDVFGGSNWLLVTPGILAGCWLVYLTAHIASRFRKGAGIAAAALVATNAYLVGYSVTIRCYIFLAAFSMAALASLYSWRDHSRWRDGVLFGVMSLLALLSSANAVYPLIAFAVVALCWTFGQPTPERWRALSRLAIPAAVCVALALAAYVPQISDIRTPGRYGSTRRPSR